jgi:hypothetical protein
MTLLRAGADPVVWANVSHTMRDVEVRDSIVFRSNDRKDHPPLPDAA